MNFFTNKAVLCIRVPSIKLGMAHKTRGTRTNYPSDVSDEEWAFCAPYLTLMREDAPQRDYSMRAIFNALRYMVRAGCPWRMIPTICPRGIPFSNKPSVGLRRAAFKPWRTICARCCGCLPASTHNLRR